MVSIGAQSKLKLVSALGFISLLTSAWSREGDPAGIPVYQSCLFQKGDYCLDDSKVKELVHNNHHKNGIKNLILLELEQMKLKSQYKSKREHQHPPPNKQKRFQGRWEDMVLKPQIIVKEHPYKITPQPSSAAYDTQIFACQGHVTCCLQTQEVWA